MSVPSADRMTREEIRAGVSLASIFSLRMLGLFLILPIFALSAKTLPGGDNLVLVGLAMGGAYGLTQALLYVPYGIASDRFGRKPVIVLGLVVFAGGSFLAAAAHGIYLIIAGRALQGAGAISAAVMALAADLTREQHRTKVMAMIGSSIGLMFAVSLVLAPVLYHGVGLAGIFGLTGVLALGAVFVVMFVVPSHPRADAHQEGAPVRFIDVLRDRQLLRLDYGILALHVSQVTMFIVIPSTIVSEGGLGVGEHWKVYLPVLAASFLLMLPPLVIAERRAKIKPVFVGSVLLLLFAQLGFAFARDNFVMLVAELLLFFVAFNLLEATLPSLVSRVAPPRAKGAALGVYNTSQSIGISLGGAIGGTLAQHLGSTAVFVFAAGLSLIWVALAASMRGPPVIAVKEFFIHPHVDLTTVQRELSGLPGVREARVEPDKRMAYIKVNLERWDEGRLRKLLGGET